MLNILLQETSQIVVDAAVDNKSLLDTIKEGGLTMIPLFLMALIAIAILIERLLTLNGASKNVAPFMAQIKELVLAKNINGALELSEKEGTPLSRMINKGLRRLGSPLKTIEESIETVGKIEIDRLEKNLSFLATIAGAAPMIGFLGTVLGMMQTFDVIANEANQDVGDMASGISMAMVTTAAGLIVGIIAYISYNFLSNKVQKIVHNLEHSSVDFLDVLHEPQK